MTGISSSVTLQIGPLTCRFPLILQYSYKCFRSGGSPAFRSHHRGALESQSWLIWMKKGESKNIGVFYLPALSSECIPFQWRKDHLTHFNLLSFFLQSWDTLWTVPPDLTWRLEKYMVQPDQSKPCSAVRLMARFPRMALPLHIKPAENVIFFFF